MKDLVREIWSTVSNNRMRTCLTGFSVAWGIFMLITLLGAGNGVLNALLNGSGSLVDNSIEIYSGITTKPCDGLPEGRWMPLKEQDAEVLQEDELLAARTEEVSGNVRREGMAYLEGRHISVSLRGISPVHQEIKKIRILHGRPLNQMDVEKRRKVLTISEKGAKTLLDGKPSELIVGKSVEIDGMMYKVVGVFESVYDSPLRAETYIPSSTMRAIYSSLAGRVDYITMTVDASMSDEEELEFERRYRSIFNASHRAASDDNGTVYIRNAMRENKSIGMVVRIIRTALWILGLFTLVGGIVGVSNIMLISVRERTHEIGIRKAIGAGVGSIMTLIIAESVSITTFFGYLGMVAGILGNELLDKFFGGKPIDAGLGEVNIFLNPGVGMDVALGALAVLIVAGTLAGLAPAWKAAKVRPIEALRNN